MLRCKNTPKAKAPNWEDLAEAALGQMQTPEQALVRRIAEARGRRVPISELVSAFGLPPAPSPEQDFPGLGQFIGARLERGEEVTMPIVASGTDDKGWYWMSPMTSGAFRRAFRRRDDSARAGNQESRAP
jgi:hypothetical protein